MTPVWARPWLSPSLCVARRKLHSLPDSVGCGGAFAAWDPAGSEEVSLWGARRRLGYPVGAVTSVSCDSATEPQGRPMEGGWNTPTASVGGRLPQASARCVFQARPHLLGPLQGRLCELE